MACQERFIHGGYFGIPAKLVQLRPKQFRSTIVDQYGGAPGCNAKVCSPVILRQVWLLSFLYILVLVIVCRHSVACIF